MAIAMGERRLREHGFDTDYCLVTPDDAPEAQMVAALRAHRYDCVVIGGGIRKPEQFLELFERTVNLTTGENSVDCVGSRTRAPATEPAETHAADSGRTPRGGPRPGACHSTTSWRSPGNAAVARRGVNTS
jgi:DNA-binding LacI/PurR family transcriptional regulator